MPGLCCFEGLGDLLLLLGCYRVQCRLITAGMTEEKCIRCIKGTADGKQYSLVAILGHSHGHLQSYSSSCQRGFAVSWVSRAAASQSHNQGRLSEHLLQRSQQACGSLDSPKARGCCENAQAAVMAQEQTPCQSVWANLPKEIVETLGMYLDASGWAAARSTCVHWSKSITHGITLLEIDLERDAHRCDHHIFCVCHRVDAARGFSNIRQQLSE
jgi:hypothetical protein